MSERPRRTGRGDYVRFFPVQTRWTDNDMYGHANNALYYEWFDLAVNRLMMEEGGLDPTGGPVMDFVVESGCRYHEGVGFPDALEVGIRVGRLGTSSVRWECAVFHSGAPLAAADGFFVHVFVDRATRRPTPIPPPLRRVMEPLLPAAI
ncbi:MAG TPA: thioesterase family protein [Geminicoccus sp.]|uniref:acyl-CoA thioesterase n=1 Tax=Geminicoccus sp. TaxID=2024832 RepID=UPI002C5A95AF|nr:thioesterase family protein [Geminicoccus sp.]HWL71691.1 thioesterase family protein [Geminicoccus sp.]